MQRAVENLSTHHTTLHPQTVLLLLLLNFFCLPALQLHDTRTFSGVQKGDKQGEKKKKLWIYCPHEQDEVVISKIPDT